MSACLVYGCPARLHSHASAMCVVSSVMRAHVLRSRPGPACFVACCALPVLAFSPALPCPLRDTCPNPNDVSPDLQPADYEMQTNEIPTSAPGDRAPTSEVPSPIKMTNQQAELEQAAVCAANELNLCTNLPCVLDASPALCCTRRTCSARPCAA